MQSTLGKISQKKKIIGHFYNLYHFTFMMVKCQFSVRILSGNYLTLKIDIEKCRVRGCFSWTFLEINKWRLRKTRKWPSLQNMTMVSKITSNSAFSKDWKKTTIIIKWHYDFTNFENVYAPTVP